MENNKKELLNRVLLLMNYDNKKTLNENRQIILNEQGSNDPIPLFNFNDMTGPAIWLNKQTNHNSKEFQNVWRDYITIVSTSTIENLLKTQKALFDNGYGPMTPGLYGFYKPNPGISNIPLENQIYALELKNYNKKTKSGVIVPKPSPPQYNLIRWIVKAQSTNLGDILYKTATQINNEYKKTDQQKKEKTNEKKCYFKNKEEGDNFRLYVNSVYKNVAKEIDLDIKGDFCNTNINKAYDYKLPTGGSFKTVGEAYKFFISYDPKKAESDLLKISREDLGYGGDRLDAERDIKILTKKAEAQKKSDDRSKALDNMEAEYQKQYDKRKEKQLEKYDFSTFPTPTDSYMGKPNYGEIERWKEPNTGKVFFISGKSLEDIKNDIVNEVEFENQQRAESEILNNPLLVQIFGKEKLQDSIKNCKKENLLGFFEKVLNYQYKTNGNTIGKYAINNQGYSYFVTWPKNAPIPCTDEFWEEWEGVFMWGSMLLSIALTIPTLGASLVPLGTTIGTRLFLAAALDVGSNLVSASQNYRAGNKEEAKMDLVIAMLSAMVEIPAVSKYLTNGFDDWGEQALREEFSNAGITSYKEFKQWLSTKTPDQQMVFRNILDDDLVQNEIKQFAESQNSPIIRVTQAMDAHIGKVTGKSKMGNLGTTILQNIKFKVPISVSPTFFDLGYEYYEQVYLGLESITGERPSHEDVEIFMENYKKYFPDEDELKKQFKDNPEQFMKTTVQMKGEQYKLKSDEMYTCKYFKPPKKVTWKECFAEGSRQADLQGEQIRKWQEQQSTGIDDKNCKSENCESEVEEIYQKVNLGPLDN